MPTKARRLKLLTIARQFAIASASQFGTVTIDDIHIAFSQAGLPPLGKFAGGVFKDPRFRRTGRYIATNRAQGHRRKVAEWTVK